MPTPEELITAHMHLIPRLARRLKFEWPTADVQELEGAGYLALVKAASSYTGANGCKFSTYLYECAHGAMLRAFSRPDGHRGYAEQEWLQLSDLSAHPSRPAQQLDEVVALERAGLVAAAMARLKPKHSAVLRRVYFDEASVPAVAREWGMKYDRAKKILRTAKAALRAEMEGRAAYVRNRPDSVVSAQ